MSTGLAMLVLVELTKLRRSLALLLCVVAPSAVAGLSFLIAIDRDKALAWTMFMFSDLGRKR